MSLVEADDLPIVWDPSWPGPVCPKGDSTHQFVTVKTERWNGLICDCCGILIRSDEMVRVLSWWQSIERRVSEDWGRN